jgi:transposase
MDGSLSIADIKTRIQNDQEIRNEEKEEPIEIAEYSDDGLEQDDGNYGKVPGYISAEEIAERYKQSKKWVHYLTRTKRVPRVQKAGFLFYDEKVVDELFSRYTSVDNITEWYTCDDIEQKYNMTAVARRSFTHRHNIPTKKEYGITYYSKVHVDYAKNPGIQYADEYYTVDQIVDIYRVGKNTVYNAIRHYKVPSLKDGNFGVYLKTAIDKIFKDKKRPEQQ